MVEAGSVTRERLPEDLETYIKEDIKQFEADLLNWDQQLLKNQVPIYALKNKSPRLFSSTRVRYDDQD